MSPKSLVATACLAIVIAFVLSLLISRGQGGDRGRVMDPPVIRTSAESNDYLAKAEKLSLKLIEKQAQGETLTEAEKDDLREAANIFKGIIAFEPRRFAPYYGEGRIRYALGDYQAAVDLMFQCIQLAPPPKPKPPIEVVQMVADAHYISSRSLFFLKRYETAARAAELALTLAPSSPDYAVAWAAAELELKNETKAEGLVMQALLLDPGHKEALRLAKFLNMDLKGLPAGRKVN